MFAMIVWCLKSISPSVRPAERTLTMENLTINGNVTVNVTNSTAEPATDTRTTATPEINITENTTLGEMLKLLNLGEKPHEIHTPRKLRDNAGKPVACYPVSNISNAIADIFCTVYSNGFAVYDNSSGRTVLWLPDCKSFTYVFTRPKASEEGALPYKEQISDDMLESLTWFTAVMLIGDHRIENNLMNRKSGRCMSIDYDSYDYDDKHFTDEDAVKDPYRGMFLWNDGRFGEDPLDALIRAERNKEMIAAMTDKQREVFLLYYKDGYTQQQIADMLGLTKQSVSERLSTATGRLKKILIRI